MRHQMIDVGSSGKTYFRKRSSDGLRLPSVPVVGAADAFSEESTYFVVERALGDGSLPDPSPQAEANGWIGEYQWDMLIYMWSNAEIRSTSESFWV